MTTEKKPKASTESIVQEIKRRIRRKFTAEEKIRIVLEGLRGDESITDLCRRKESIPPCTTNGVKPFWWRITKDFYNKKRQEYRIKQEEIQKKMSNLQKTDEEYYITASYILSLANHAYSLFMSSEREVKRQQLIL